VPFPWGVGRSNSGDEHACPPRRTAACRGQLLETHQLPHLHAELATGRLRLRAVADGADVGGRPRSGGFVATSTPPSNGRTPTKCREIARETVSRGSDDVAG
jgi:hypothetical protein